MTAGARRESAASNVYLSVSLNLPAFDLFHHFDHQRDLDRAHRLHLTVGVDRELFVRLERLHVDAPRGVDARGSPQDRSLEPLKRRLLRLCE